MKKLVKVNQEGNRQWSVAKDVAFSQSENSQSEEKTFIIITNYEKTFWDKSLLISISILKII